LRSKQPFNNIDVVAILLNR